MYLLCLLATSVVQWAPVGLEQTKMGDRFNVNGSNWVGSEFESRKWIRWNVAREVLVFFKIWFELLDELKVDGFGNVV